MSIKIYTTPTCVYCKMTKEYFMDRGIPYEEIDLTKDYNLVDEMYNKSGQMGVPVIDVNGKIIIGFSKKKIEEVLKKESNNNKPAA